MFHRAGDCYPLTVTDRVARFLPLRKASASTREDTTITAFEQVIVERGLRTATRCNNGVPFANPNAQFNLSKLFVWWSYAGIGIPCIKSDHTEQDGRHERMHLTPIKGSRPSARQE